MSRNVLIVLISLVVAGILLSLPLPVGLSAEGRFVAVIGLVMATWWMTEAIPLPATALVPLIVLPFSGTVSLESVAANYAHPLILLFFGGFALAAALQRWHLHHRLAVAVLSIAGRNRSHQLLAVMSVTAFLSLWISNTATAMVMLPLGLSLAAGHHAEHADERSSAGAEGFAVPLMLGIAYAATIGGIGSLIGTPPNALFAAHMAQAHGVHIGFGQWMMLGVPLAAVLLIVTWLMLTRIFYRIGGEAPGRSPRLEQSSGPLSRGQRLVTAVLCVTGLLWLVRPLIGDALGLAGLSDASIAIAAVVILLSLPESLSDGRPLLTWDDIQSIRWDVLILFGGGLALADAIGSSGVASWLAGQVQGLAGLPLPVIVLVLIVVVVGLGELASNTAIAAIFLPVASAVAITLDQSALTIALPVALAASLGFALPVATPPNAIVYGSGAISAGQMLRVGAALDAIAILIIFLAALALGPFVLG